MVKSSKLPRVQLAGLDFATIIEDIKNLVQNNPEYNENWDNFLESNAGRMIIEFFSYIAEQISTRIDWVANEGYTSTATQKKSIIRLLKLIGYNFSLPVAAHATVVATPERLTGGKIILTNGFVAGYNFVPFSLTGKDPSGYDINFEALAYSIKDKKFLYQTSVLMDLALRDETNTVNTEIDFYEGKTYTETFTITTDNSPKFSLSYSPIIQDSVSVFNGGEELLLVKSFLASEAQIAEQGGVKYSIPYVINIKENDNAEIEFGSISLLPESSRRAKIGDTITVVYRVGGGIAGNITENGINVKKTLKDSSGNSVNVLFKNETPGIGGAETETVDHALYYAPQSLKTVEKTVTEDDYNTIVGAYKNMLLSKSYGNSNMPSNFYDKYGVYINPMEVWNFIALNKSSVKFLKPTEYNKFKWADLRLENRLNEELSFNSGGFNYPLQLSRYLRTKPFDFAIEKNGGSKTYNNYAFLIPPSDFVSNVNVIRNEETGIEEINQTIKMMILKTATEEVMFRDLIKPEKINTWFIKDTNHPYLTLEGTSKNLVCEEQTFAELFSNKDLEYFTFNSSKLKIKFAIDYRKAITITFTNNTTYRTQEIVDYLNSELVAQYHGIQSGITPYPFAYGYNLVNIQDATGQEISSIIQPVIGKTICPSLDSYNFDNPLKIKLQLITKIGTPVERVISINLKANANGSPVVTAPAGNTDRDYIIKNIDGVAEEMAYNQKSFVDITKIINRVLYNENIPVEAIITNDVPDRGVGCYDIYFKPLDNQRVDTDIAIRGVKILGCDIFNEDLIGYLRNLTQGTFVIPKEKRWADYGQTFSVIQGLPNEPNKKFIYIKSPLIGENYSSIETIHSGIQDCFMDLFAYEFGSCKGIRRISLITNNSTSEEGYLIYEANTYAYPTYFDTTNIMIIKRGSVTENVEIYNKLYFNYIRDPKESLQLGNTSEFYTNDTVKYLYNTTLDTGKKIDLNISKFDIKFTRREIDINSVYVVDNNPNKIDLKQADFAKKETIALGEDILVPGYFNANDYLVFNADGHETISLSLNGIVNLTTLQQQIVQAINAFTSYEDGSYYVQHDILKNKLIFKNNVKNSDGKLTFIYKTGTPANSGFIKLFGSAEVPDISNNLTYTCSGDYYLTFENNKIFINKLASSINIPDSKAYVHYINDRRYEVNSAGSPVRLEEDEIMDYLHNYKVLGVTNILKIPKFKTFDIIGTVYFNPLKTSGDIQSSVETALRNEYNLENAVFGRNIVKSQLFKIIHDIPGVEYAKIDYLGYQYGDTVGVDNILSSGFDEILVLCEDIYDENGVNRIRGLGFKYEAV